MGLDDKLKHEAEDAKGKAKEFVGDKVGNPDLEAEGQREQAEAKLRQAGEHVKDAARDAKDAVS